MQWQSAGLTRDRSKKRHIPEYHEKSEDFTAPVCARRVPVCRFDDHRHASLSYSASFFEDDEDAEPGKFEQLLDRVFARSWRVRSWQQFW